MGSNVFLGAKWGPLVHDRERDAVHIAVVMAEAGERLKPGQWVTMFEGKAITARGVDMDAVVDPFLREPVEPGERCWLLLVPHTVRDLHHEWQHPAFPRSRPDYAAMSESERWLRDKAREYQIDYDDMIQGAVSGAGAVFGTSEHYDLTEGRKAELWHHISVVTGKTFAPEHIDKVGWGCSC